MKSFQNPFHSVPFSIRKGVSNQIQTQYMCISVSKGRDVPGQTGTGRPVVPLSRDKKKFLSRCPVVPGQGQEQMSRDKFLCPGPSRDKTIQKFSKKKIRFTVLEHHFPVLEHPFLFQNVLFCFRASFFCFRTSFSALSRFVPRPVPVFGCPGPSRPGFWLSRPVPSLGKIFSLSRCPFVPGQ